MKQETESVVLDRDDGKTPMAIATRAGHTVTVASAATPGDLLRYAMESGADLDRLEKLMDMQLAWERNEARKAYHVDMAEFKKNPPTILKSTHVMYKTDKGVTQYDHASLGEVCEKIIEGLAQHGFSHRWAPGKLPEGRRLITCIITHRLGHSEDTPLDGPLDTSGGKNNIQAAGSTDTYLCRYSLLLATGLAPKNMPDDDGRGSGGDVKEREFQVQNFVDEALKFTKDAPCLKYWNEHKAKFAEFPADFKLFKDEVARHRAFIKSQGETA